MSETALDNQELQESLTKFWKQWRWPILSLSGLFLCVLGAWVAWKTADEHWTLAHSEQYEKAHIAWLTGDRSKATAHYTALLPTQGYGPLSQLHLQAMDKPLLPPEVFDKSSGKAHQDPLAWPHFLGYGYQILALGESLPVAYLKVLDSLQPESAWFPAAWELRVWHAIMHHHAYKHLMDLIPLLPAHSGYAARAKILMRAAGLSSTKPLPSALRQTS